MPKKKQYDSARPSVPTDIERAVKVESGHACAIRGCGEHTYLELHHINGNREDNRVANLLALCDKHHKMAHAGVIDRKALREYKRLLKRSYDAELMRRITRLERLFAQAPKVDRDSGQGAAGQAKKEVVSKTVTPRARLSYIAIEELALTKFERDFGVLLERQPELQKGSARLHLDAVRQDDALKHDVIVEVRWIRKRYLDAPVYVRQLIQAISTYDLLTGRKARGVLILVVPKAEMKGLDELPYTKAEILKTKPRPKVVIYSYEDLGFTPSPISAEIFSKNMQS